MESLGIDIKNKEVKHLPIVAAFAQKLNLVEEIDRILNSQMELSPGKVVLGLILDALSGRTPLFRLHEFFRDVDTELLLGEDIPPAKFSDDNVGRLLDRIYQVGTQRILSAISLNAVKMFDLDTQAVHFDTTSINVWGDYAMYAEGASPIPFAITYGFSKEKRFDLKQFVVSLLSVEHGVPIFFKCEDGNASDKKLNGNILAMIAKKMAKIDAADFNYIADSALVCPDNLDLIDKYDLHFISRLPSTYNECSRVISAAVQQNQWDIIGTLALTPATKNRQPASYKVAELEVVLYDRPYRAIVVHSDAHDKRRLKRLDKTIASDLKTLKQTQAELQKQVFFCLPDAQKAAQAKISGALHRLDLQVVQQPVYQSGRPKKDGSRAIKEMRYGLSVTIVPEQEKISQLQQEAGCFVLLTNRTPDELSARQVLKLYKDQHHIEQNFGFLKDPVIVNEFFLKKPERIEALGLIMVLALMIWRLIERTMRLNLKENADKVPGWDKKPTDRPTSFMMSTKFSSISTNIVQGKRYLNEPIDAIQSKYLEILGLSPAIFLQPINCSP